MTPSKRWNSQILCRELHRMMGSFCKSWWSLQPVPFPPSVKTAKDRLLSQSYWAKHYSGVASPGESRLQHTATARRKDRDWSGLGLEKTPMDPLKNDGMLAARPAPHILVVQEPPCPSSNAQGNSKKATVPQPLWIGCFAIHSSYSAKQAPHGELGTIRSENKRAVRIWFLAK